MAKQPTQTRVRRREKKNITAGVAHVSATFNNTMITITDAQGNAISWSSAGLWVLKGQENRPLMQHRLLQKTLEKKLLSTVCKF